MSLFINAKWNDSEKYFRKNDEICDFNDKLPNEFNTHMSENFCSIKIVRIRINQNCDTFFLILFLPCKVKLDI